MSFPAIYPDRLPEGQCERLQIDAPVVVVSHDDHDCVTFLNPAGGRGVVDRYAARWHQVTWPGISTSLELLVVAHDEPVLPYPPGTWLRIIGTLSRSVDDTLVLTTTGPIAPVAAPPSRDDRRGP